MSEILTITFICSYEILIVAWVISMVAWIICRRRYLQLAEIVRHVVKFPSSPEYLKDFIFILRILGLFADGTSNHQQTFESGEIRVFLCENLTSAKITINGKNDWKLVLDEGGELLIVLLGRAGADLTKWDENGKTILHVAVEQKNESVVLLLRSLGFNMALKDATGKTALDIANEGKMTGMQNLLQGHAAV